MEFEIERKETYSYDDVQGLLSRCVQSETDKVRTEYSRRLKSVQAELDSIKPKEKSDAEKALDEREATLNERECRFFCKSVGIPEEYAVFFRPDADLEKLGKLFGSRGSYVPQAHKKSDGITKEQWQNLSYPEQERLFAQNPEIAKQFI